MQSSIARLAFADLGNVGLPGSNPTGSPGFGVPRCRTLPGSSGMPDGAKRKWLGKTCFPKPLLSDRDSRRQIRRGRRTGIRSLRKTARAT